MQRRSFISGIFAPIVLAAIPGFGHIWLHRPLRGLFLFIFFTGTANVAALLALDLKCGLPAAWLQPAGALAASVYTFAFLDVVRLVLWAGSKSAEARRAALFKDVVARYIAKEYGRAEESANRMLRIDPCDGTALVYLGLISGARGHKRKAIGLLKKALRFRRDEETTEDILRELKRLKEDPGR